MEFQENYIFRFLFILTICISYYIPLAITFRTGAPTSKCQSMVPGHFIWARDLNDTSSPFKTTIEKINVTGGQHIRIVLSSSQPETKFKGFLVMVRKPGVDTMSYGEFLDQDDPDSQGVNCFGNENSAMTHTYNNEKEEVNLTWVAPKNSHDEEYNVVVTFVESFRLVWDNQVHREKIRVARTIEIESGDKKVRQGPPQSTIGPNRPNSNPTADNEATSFMTNIFSTITSWLW